MSIYFGLYKIILLENISIPRKTVKGPGIGLCSKRKSWEDGIMKLPELWQKIVEPKGEYVVQ